MIVRFKRENPESIPQWAEDHFYNIGNDDYSCSIVDFLPIIRNGKPIEWATLGEIMQDIQEYNAQPQNERFDEYIGYVAASLLKCVEAGLVSVKQFDN